MGQYGSKINKEESMKKYILFGLSALVLYGCGENKISQDLVKRYETTINAKLKEQVGFINEKYNGVSLEIPDFKCGADDSFIKCVSNDIKLTEKETEFLNIRSVEFRSNEVYRGENKGLISVKEYYERLFKDNKELETSFNVEGVRFSEKVIENVSKDTASLPNDIRALILEFVADEYGLSGTAHTASSNGELKYDISQKLYNTKNSIDLDYEGSLNVKESVFVALEEEMGAKFDTQTLSFNKDFTDKLSSQFDLFLPRFTDLGKNFISLNHARLNLSLNTQNVFEPYINIAKGYLGTQKNQNRDQKEALLISEILGLLEDIAKDPVYKVNVKARFKNVLLKDYPEEGLELIQELTINGKDFTDTFKELTFMIGGAGLKRMGYGY